MVIAVTGAAGRGRRVRRRRADRARPRGRRRRPQEPSPSDADVPRADVESTASLVEAFAGCDAIVHLAAIAEAGIAPARRHLPRQRAGHGELPRGRGEVGAPLRARLIGGGTRVRLPRARDEARLLSDRRRPPAAPAGQLRPEQGCRGGGVPRLRAPGRALHGLHPAVLLLGHQPWRRGHESLQNPADHYRSLWVYVHLRDIARAYRLACEKGRHRARDVLRRGLGHPLERADGGARRALLPGRPAQAPHGRPRRVDPNDRAGEVLGFEPELSWRDEVSPDDGPLDPRGDVSTVPEDPHAAAERGWGSGRRKKRSSSANEWVASAEGGSREVTRPSTGDAVRRVAEAGEEDVTAAVAARHALLSAGAALSPFDRSRMLRRIAAGIERNAEAFALSRARRWQATRDVARRGGLRGRVLRLLRVTRGPDRGVDPLSRGGAGHRPARAGRQRRNHHPVQLPAHPERGQDRERARRGLRCRAQAVRAHSTVSPRTRAGNP